MSDKMNIEELAIKADLKDGRNVAFRGGRDKLTSPELKELCKLERFAALVLEQAAQKCLLEKPTQKKFTNEVEQAEIDAIDNCAEAIRAMKPTQGE